MARPLKLLGRPQGARAMILPLSTTPDDIRRIVRLLKKKPDGITVGDVLDGIFDPRRVATYELLEIIVRNGQRLKLSSLGWELARKLEPEIQLFRFILNGVEPYRSVLVCAHRQHTHVLLTEEVAEHWLERYPRFFGSSDHKIINSMAVCFFHLCQAAALGYVSVEEEQVPIRLHFDDGELAEYIAAEPLSHLTEVSSVDLETGEKQQNVAPKDSPPGGPIKIPVSGSTNIQTIALKVLAQALVKEVEALSEPRDVSDARKLKISAEVCRFETELIRSALALTGGRQRRAAHLLGMSKTVLNAKVKRYNITSE